MGVSARRGAALDHRRGAASALGHEEILLSYAIADWLRAAHRKVDALRRYAETLGSTDEADAIFERAARLETFAAAVEHALDEAMLLGRRLEAAIDRAWLKMQRAS